MNDVDQEFEDACLKRPDCVRFSTKLRKGREDTTYSRSLLSIGDWPEASAMPVWCEPWNGTLIGYWLVVLSISGS